MTSCGSDDAHIAVREPFHGVLPVGIGEPSRRRQNGIVGDGGEGRSIDYDQGARNRRILLVKNESDESGQRRPQLKVSDWLPSCPEPAGMRR